jgi:hypothetical protein
LPVAGPVEAGGVNTTADLVVVGSLAAIWLAAGLLADGLPTARTAHELHRRAGLLSMLVAAGATVFVAVPVVTALVPGASAAPAAALLPAVPALIVLTAGLHRLTVLRRGAGAFATAPLAPLPPALRASAAHPLIAAPLQVTGLAALVGLPVAGRLVTVPGADVAGIAITVVGVAVVSIGVRHALRHSRLSLLALAPIRRAPRRLTSRPG